MKPQKEETKNKFFDEENSDNATGSSKNILPNTENNLPDEQNNKNNPHDSDNTTDNIILELPKNNLENLKNIKKIKNEIIFTQEYIIKLIEEELENVYKDHNLKINKLDDNIEKEKELKKNIKKFEEKIIPIIEKEINFYHLDKEEEIKKTVHKTVELELKEQPLLPPLKIEVTKTPQENKTSSPQTSLEDKTLNKKETSNPIDIELPQLKEKMPIYSVARQEERNLNLNELELPKIKSEPIAIVEDIIEIKENLEKHPTSMIKHTETLPKPSLKDTIINTAAVSTMIAAKTAEEILKPTEQTTQIKDEDLKQIEENIEHKAESLEDIKEIQRELEEKIEEIKNEEQEQKAQLDKIEEEHTKETIDEKKKQIEEKTKEKEEVVKDLVRDSEVSALSISSDSAIEDAKTEIAKEDFFDKDYDRIEAQINKMLDDITNTRLRYGNKLSSKQKYKLDREESKLRDAKSYIESQKSKDIEFEQKQLNDYITESEYLGLQQELKKIDNQNKEEVNEEFLRRMEKLEGMTQEQVANVDKRILMKRLNKASMLLEMGSILAFPFIRNRYFLYFTLGLIIDNHFNFINAFWRRKVHKYEPADLSKIKQGQDALNGALDITFQNIIELDKIEQDAISRYPELANDERFISQVTNLRIKLNNNYNKLMRKNKIMETYYGKTKHQVKVLKKDLKNN